ncbi:lysozyme [Sphingomonas sp. RIT328]|uniref:lysozyme n=1 Tax=Sphingomonas sp. RIT328 TaxID=1470591 RepID=UPI000453A624|nr:lysozyme [Sphingomonas sp. RIT328]EZP57417.1 Lysozyme RrrD [Sphingomonas sp. RIT328]
MVAPDRPAATRTSKPGKKTLAGVIGSVVAAATLFVVVPKEESGRQVKATVNADQSITVEHVAGKQYLDAYLDIVKVPTACDGITKGVKMGMRFTPERCNELLEEELIAHAEPIVRCVPALKGRTNQVIAAVSLSYNIGTAGFCRSSIARVWNAGQWRAGCDRFLLFNKAGGRTVAGLAKRRERERAICVQGLAA